MANERAQIDRFGADRRIKINGEKWSLFSRRCNNGHSNCLTDFEELCLLQIYDIHSPLTSHGGAIKSHVVSPNNSGLKKLEYSWMDHFDRGVANCGKDDCAEKAKCYKCVTMMRGLIEQLRQGDN